PTARACKGASPAIKVMIKINSTRENLIFICSSYLAGCFGRTPFLDWRVGSGLSVSSGRYNVTPVADFGNWLAEPTTPLDDVVETLALDWPSNTVTTTRAASGLLFAPENLCSIVKLTPGNRFCDRTASARSTSIVWPIRWPALSRKSYVARLGSKLES